MKPLIIGQIATSKSLANPGGLERFVASVNNIREFDSSFEIVSLGNFHSDNHWLMKSAMIFIRAMKQYRRISVIESHHILSGFVTALIFPKPIIVFFHSPWAEEQLSNGDSSKISYFLRKKIEKVYLSRSTHIATVGKSMRDYLINDHNIPASKIVVVGAGVNFRKFNSLTRKKEGLHVFAARRLEPRMGLVDLILAWNILDPQLRGTLRIAGIGSQFELLQKTIIELDLAETVSLLGRVSEEELIENYQEATLTVIPTRTLEGFGLVCLESLACGTPVISSKEGELQYLIGEEWPYLTFDSGEPAQLAGILSQVSTGNIGLPSSFECQQYAAQFTWEKTSEAIASIYRATK